MNKLKLACRCSTVSGVAQIDSPSSGNRVVCCCSDCQAFAEFLGSPQIDMDEYGGTDIYQMPISKLTLTRGAENLACLRLSEKGLYRWYAACCNTPIGNTLGASAPFIGLIHSFIDDNQSLDKVIGPSRGHIQLRSARARVPDKLVGASLAITLRALGKLTIWKLKGFNKPSVFFADDGKPVVKPSILP